MERPTGRPGRISQFMAFLYPCYPCNSTALVVDSGSPQLAVVAGFSLRRTGPSARRGRRRLKPAATMACEISTAGTSAVELNRLYHTFMFTGLVESLGTVRSVATDGAGTLLTIEEP